MGKTLEQTIHEAELPVPSATGEDFNSYVSRVAHAAAFIGAAWAIANGPQAQGPQPPTPAGGIFDGPSADYVKQPSQDEPHEHAHPVADPTFDNPIRVGEQGDDPDEAAWKQPRWDERPEGEVTDGPDEEPDVDPLGATQPGGVQRTNGKHR